MMTGRDPEVGAADAPRVVAGWFERHVDTIHGYLCRRVGTEVAYDVTAETFRVALAEFDRFDPARGNERAWLYGIATNLLRRHWRSEQRTLRTQHRSVTASAVAVDPLLAVEEQMDARRDVERVLAAVELLEPDDRDLLLLTVWEGLSSAEVAVALGIPAGTVRSRLHRIRTELRAHRPQGPQGGST